MRKDSSEVFRARGSNEVRSLSLMFWAMDQDMADSLCMPTAVGISGTRIEASQAFRPITSVRRSMSTVVWYFDRLS